MTEPHPIDRIAEKWLPPKWRGSAHPALTLIRWGLEDGNLEVHRVAPDDPTMDQVERMLNSLASLPGDQGLRKILNPENAPGETQMQPAELEQADDRLDAAMTMLDLLYSAMKAWA